jgi:hypothetical protein
MKTLRFECATHELQEHHKKKLNPMAKFFLLHLIKTKKVISLDFNLLKMIFRYIGIIFVFQFVGGAPVNAYICFFQLTRQTCTIITISHKSENTLFHLPCFHGIEAQKRTND